MKKVLFLLALSSGIASTDTTSISLTITDNTIDWANLQYPENGSADMGTAFNVYAQVYESGVTNGTGQGSGISGWIGTSSTNSDPSGADWTWTTAAYNADNGNNDEYIVDIGTGMTSMGTYYYASRFTIDGGTTYVYGGYSASGGGFWDGTNFVNGTLTVTGNNVPILASIADQAMTEDILTTLTLSATDADSDALTYTITGGSSETVSGSINGTTLTFTGATNYNTSTAISFIVTVSDGNGGTDSDTLGVTVTPVNDSPIIATLSDQTGSEGTELTFGITATDVDGDGLTWASESLPTGATFIDNTDGSATFTWTPNYTQSGTYSGVKFIVSDGQGGTVVAQVNTQQLSRR
ncbi:MAG: cadherin-like domain-containing protein [Candidatus Marinimicrobia bacterium]|nr:cadherin-like domain-containing protein [Candidatus Neomarinimicrobiota bacterium]